ncbi:MAG: AraC family ligand binding domain-containing protein, partial [Acutalibacteraceae bacterium]|nr:AraC family ligand binding domain-containing protein [Acutalibacteraceae bacterium]
MSNSLFEVPKSDAGDNGIAIQKRVLNSSFPTHLHSIFELEYILDGEAVTYIDNKPFLLTKGSLKLCTPLDVEFLEVQSNVT